MLGELLDETQGMPTTSGMPNQYVGSRHLRGRQELPQLGGDLSGSTGRRAGRALSEAGTDGYTASAWSCTGFDNGGSLTGSSLTLEEGENVICTITNDDDPATLTLVKRIINDNGGDLALADVTTTGNPTTADLPDNIQTPYGYYSFDIIDTTGLTTGFTATRAELEEAADATAGEDQEETESEAPSEPEDEAAEDDNGSEDEAAEDDNGSEDEAAKDDNGSEDEAAEAVWKAHLRRMEARTHDAHAVEPDLRVSRRDPFGLRYIALLAFIVALLFGFFGAMWSTLGARVRRRQGLPYYRWAFIMGMLGVFAFTLAAFEQRTFTRQRLIPVALFAMAVQTTIFAIGVRADLARKPSARKDDDE